MRPAAPSLFAPKQLPTLFKSTRSSSAPYIQRSPSRPPRRSSVVVPGYRRRFTGRPGRFDRRPAEIHPNLTGSAGLHDTPLEGSWKTTRSHK